MKLRIGFLFRPALAFLALSLISSGRGQAPAPAQPAPAAKVAVDLKVIKYDALTEFIKSQKGRIVVADIWAEW